MDGITYEVLPVKICGMPWPLFEKIHANWPYIRKSYYFSLGGEFQSERIEVSRDGEIWEPYALEK